MPENARNAAAAAIAPTTAAAAKTTDRFGVCWGDDMPVETAVALVSEPPVRSEGADWLSASVSDVVPRMRAGSMRGNDSAVARGSTWRSCSSITVCIFARSSWNDSPRTAASAAAEVRALESARYCSRSACISAAVG